MSSFLKRNVNTDCLLLKILGLPDVAHHYFFPALGHQVQQMARLCKKSDLVIHGELESVYACTEEAIRQFQQSFPLFPKAKGLLIHNLNQHEFQIFHYVVPCLQHLTILFSSCSKLVTDVACTSLTISDCTNLSQIAFSNHSELRYCALIRVQNAKLIVLSLIRGYTNHPSHSPLDLTLSEITFTHDLSIVLAKLSMSRILSKLCLHNINTSSNSRIYLYGSQTFRSFTYRSKIDNGDVSLIWIYPEYLDELQLDAHHMIDFYAASPLPNLNPEAGIQCRCDTETKFCSLQRISLGMQIKGLNQFFPQGVVKTDRFPELQDLSIMTLPVRDDRFKRFVVEALPRLFRIKCHLTTLYFQLETQSCLEELELSGHLDNWVIYTQPNVKSCILNIQNGFCTIKVGELPSLQSLIIRCPTSIFWFLGSMTKWTIEFPSYTPLLHLYVTPICNPPCHIRNMFDPISVAERINRSAEHLKRVELMFYIVILERAKATFSQLASYLHTSLPSLQTLVLHGPPDVHFCLNNSSLCRGIESLEILNVPYKKITLRNLPLLHTFTLLSISFEESNVDPKFSMSQVLDEQNDDEQIWENKELRCTCESLPRLRSLKLSITHPQNNPSLYLEQLPSNIEVVCSPSIRKCIDQKGQCAIQ